MRFYLQLLLLALIPLPVALARVLWPAPVLLLNGSPSEPTGLYVRTDQTPAVGRIIAFRPPATAAPYVAVAMPERARSSILKTVWAGQGDLVCVDHQRLAIGGHDLAPVADHDRQGRSLPQWRRCRRLVGGEYFVFSDRISNSFDSRYYGPVGNTEVIGVYRLLWAAGRAS